MNKQLFKILLAGVSALVTVWLLLLFLRTPAGSAKPTVTVGTDIQGKFQMYMSNRFSDALAGVKEIPKTYTLRDSDIAAPKPKAERFGRTQALTEVEAVIDGAAGLLDGQELFLTRQLEQLPQGSEVRYYSDETILALAWKQPVGGSMYTFAEVKIADPSQFRRFLAGGEYGSSTLFLTTDMADTVNAVVAASGDYYSYRSVGMVVYEGKVRRMNSSLIDTCLIDSKGDLQFIRSGSDWTEQEAQEYMDRNGIRFSLSFGPVLIEDGALDITPWYSLGQVEGAYCRSALCQMGSLHYLVAIASGEEGGRVMPTIPQFADVLLTTQCQKAYALDGGQTATIAMEGETVNRVAYGSQRLISDIIYFATALPEGG